MRVARPIPMDPEQRRLLEQQSWARSLAARQLEGARIVPLTADGGLDKEVAAELHVTPKKAAPWRKRYLDGGLGALQKDAPRPGRPATVLPAKVKQIVKKTTRIGARRHSLEPPKHGGSRRRK